VTLSQAGVALPGTTPEQRSLSAAGVQQILDEFFADTGWRPEYVLPVAGGLLYSVQLPGSVHYEEDCQKVRRVD
jgi:hypothetical protein